MAYASLPNVFVLEGGVCAGKTTLGHEVERVMPNCVFFEEKIDPVILADYLADPKLNAFAFQMDCLARRARRFWVVATTAIAHPETAFIIDRSLFGDFVFARLQHELGNLSPEQWDAYKLAYNALTTSLPHMRVFYLACEPEVAHRRLAERGTGEAYTLEYMQQLTEIYNETMNDLIRSNRVFVIPFDATSKSLEDSLRLVCHYISTSVGNELKGSVDQAEIHQQGVDGSGLAGPAPE